jgi:hypothetical protein
MLTSMWAYARQSYAITLGVDWQQDKEDVLEDLVEAALETLTAQEK